MRHKKFWTLDKFGNEVLRDLSKEHESFTLEKYVNNEFDGNNFIWYENFDLHFIADFVANLCAILIFSLLGWLAIKSLIVAKRFWQWIVTHRRNWDVKGIPLIPLYNEEYRWNLGN